MSTATTTRRRRAAQSTKVRPEAGPCPDQGRLGSFPPPTPWSEQLAVENLQLARAMANRMARATRMPFDDLFLVAAHGLLKGCRRYDPALVNPATGTPYRLSTFVVPCIRGAMAQWLRDRGHSSGVRFPDRWRDLTPTALRMAAAGATVAAISEAVKLPAGEVEELLAARGATRLLDPELHQSSQPDPWDETETLEALADCLAIADRAHEGLRWADRQMIEAAWSSPHRRMLAPLPHGQFLRRAEAIIRGERVSPPEEQQALALVVPEGAPGSAATPSRRITDPGEILQAVEQLALFGACPDPDQSGKTPAEETGGDGVAADQPPNNERRSAVVPSPAAG